MTHDTFLTAARALVDAVGDEVSYNGETIRAVFGAGYRSVASGDVRLASKLVELDTVVLADLPAGSLAAEDPPVPGDLVGIDGKEYEVATVRPDVERVSAKLMLKAC